LRREVKHMKEKKIWGELLGASVPSMSQPNKTYKVFLGEHGWECTCPDFQFRHGSHKYRVVFNDGHEEVIQGCKHIGFYLAEIAKEVCVVVEGAELRLAGKAKVKNITFGLFKITP